LNYEPNAGISAHRTLGTHEQQSIWEISVELDPTMPQGKGDLEEALRLKGGKD
jgi:hypothetical protein